MSFEKRCLTIGIVLIAAAICLMPFILNGQVTNTNTNQALPNGQLPEDRGKSWSTYGAKTDTSNLTLQATSGALQSVYIYEAFCTNVHASTVGVALIKYGSTTVAAVPCGPGVAGRNMPSFFDPPLKIPANTAVTMNGVTGITTLHFFAAGTIAR